MITINNIRKVFQRGEQKVEALKGISFKIEEGSIFGIIGYSGAGKSTLIRLLNGLEKGTSGDVMIGDQNISTLNERELRQLRTKIGMVFQHFNLLWSRTVLENVMFPLEVAGITKSQREQQAMELIRKVGLEGKEHAYPSELSGGQKQRVGIARALANKPKLLLCDEATSALDPETTDSILDLLRSINKETGITIVLITHEMHVIQKICDQVAVMEYGEVAEIGPVMEVFQNPKASVTKRFVKQIQNHSDNNETMLWPKGEGSFVRLTFNGQTVHEPIVSTIIRTYNVNANILQANLVQTTAGTFGTMTVKISGAEQDVQDALHYLIDHEVKTEVLTNHE